MGTRHFKPLAFQSMGRGVHANHGATARKAFRHDLVLPYRDDPPQPPDVTYVTVYLGHLVTGSRLAGAMHRSHATGADLLISLGLYPIHQFERRS